MVCNLLRGRTRYVLFTLNLLFLIFPSLAYAGEQDACAAAQASDLNDDGEVGFADITLLFGHWGHSHDGIPDPDGDGIVSFGDIFFMLPYFGSVADHCVAAIDLCGNLDLIREDLSADYILSCDVDLSGVDFEPIGTSEEPFSGTLDGQGHSISNLSLQTTGQTGVGLFGSIIGGEIRNLDVLNASVSSTGGNDVGILAGFTSFALIENCTSSGTVSGDQERTGGLVGHADPGSVIRSCSSSATVVGDFGVGGLLGVNHASLVEFCTANGMVTGRERVGGLLGYAFPDLENANPTITRHSTASGNVHASVDDATRGGGFVGYIAQGLIDNCTASGNVTGFDERAGGFAGYMQTATVLQPEPVIQNSSATGNVSANDKLGGFIGYQLGGLIDNCNATGSASGTDNIGGFVGYFVVDGTVSNSSATGLVSGDNQVGGFVGFQYLGALIDNCVASGNVNGSSRVGGFGGLIARGGTVANSLSFSDVSGSGLVGGFVGFLQEQSGPTPFIHHSASLGTIEGYNTLGGFAGQITRGIIEDSYAEVNRIGQSASGIIPGTYGGFVGVSFGATLRRVRATGNNAGSTVGGLIGKSIGQLTIQSAAAFGSIEGNPLSPFSAGGLIGFVQASDGQILIEDCYTQVDINAADLDVIAVAGLIARLGTSWEPVQGEISNCYATGHVDSGEPSASAAGLIAVSYYQPSAFTVNNSYWDITATGQPANPLDFGEGRTTAEMTSVPRPADTYVNWDFDEIWQQTNGAYPTLQALPAEE